MRVKPGLPVALSVAGVVTAFGVLLASVFTRSPVAPCPAVEGRTPGPTPKPGVCPDVVVTVLPSPTVVTTEVTVLPTVIREPGSTTVVVSPVTAAPTRTRTPSPSPTPTRTRSPSPTPCPLPTVPVVGCPGRDWQGKGERGMR